jgi:hypothetical protein
VVQGYRYDGDSQTLKQMNAFVQIQVWDKNQQVTLNDIAYTTVENQLNLYHFSDGCYTLKKDGMEERFCISENTAKYLSFIQVVGISKVSDWRMYCSSLDYRTFGTYCIQDTCFQEKISNAFVYNQIHFVKTTSDIWYCSKDFRDCKKLYETSREVLCGDSVWLMLDDGTLLEIK